MLFLAVFRSPFHSPIFTIAENVLLLGLRSFSARLGVETHPDKPSAEGVPAYHCKEIGMKKIANVFAFAAVLGIAVAASAVEKPTLPKGYEKWEKSKRRVDTDKKSIFYGIHYIYVDKKAMKTYKTGGVYPEGSRFVAVNYSIKEEGGKLVEGKKNMIVMMKKDKKQRATGGWQFAGFSPDGKLSGLDPVKDCFGCHLRDAKDTDYVISKYADF